MAKTDSEQEFVLGNKQLLSAFFVVIALLGVFFVMGYIIGQNSSNGGSKKAVQAEPAPSSSAQPDNTPPPAPVTRPEVTAPVQTVPARTAAREKAEERAEEKREEKREERAISKGRIESAPGHTYLQVSAVKRPAADSIVQTLKDKGFPALLGESSKPELFRVLVGPYAETEALAKAKSDLKSMGFDAVISK